MPRPSWCAIFTKAYAVVAARYPELRRAYLKFPFPRLYEHLNPMPYAKAVEMEVFLAESLRKRGFVVYGGH